MRKENFTLTRFVHLSDGIAVWWMERGNNYETQVTKSPSNNIQPRKNSRVAYQSNHQSNHQGNRQSNLQRVFLAKPISPVILM